MMKMATFQGKRWLLPQKTLCNTPLCTIEEYQEGRASYAHIFPDGRILRHGEVIGHRDDLSDIEDIPDIVPPDPHAAILNILAHPSWKGNCPKP